MATKQKKQSSDRYELVTRGLIAIALLYPARFINATGSRQGITNILELLGLKVDKEGKVSVNNETAFLINSLLGLGWERNDKFVTCSLGFTTKKSIKAEADIMKAERVADLEELKTLKIFSGEKGTYQIEGADGNMVDVEITHDDIVKEWSETFPEKLPLKVGRKTTMVNRFEHPDAEVVVSGNRALTCAVLVHNTVVRKAGLTDRLITEIEREKRAYADADKRADDSIYLNEAHKRGRLETSPMQKLLVTFQELERGGREKDVARVFALDEKGQRGKVQAFTVPVKLTRLLRFAKDPVTYCGKEMKGAAIVESVKADFRNGTLKPPRQGAQLKHLRKMLNMCTHSDGFEPAFAQDGPGKRKAYHENKETKLDAVETKEHLRANPEGFALIAAYWTDVRDPAKAAILHEVVTPTKSIKSGDIIKVAAEFEKGDPLQQLLEVAAGKDETLTLLQAAEKVNKQIAMAEKRYAVYNRDADANLVGEPISKEDAQAAYDEKMGLDPKTGKPKKASGRRRSRA